MSATSSVLRVVYPQWQGGIISHWIPEIRNPIDSSLGYFLGAQLLDFITAAPNQKTVTVPISTDISSRTVVDGVMDRDVILKQSKAALELIQKEDPAKIITIGGECSVSVVPFTFLAHKYKDDLLVIWLDAHPDITLPGDSYEGYHAMAVTAIMGHGEKEIISSLPSTVSPSNILFVGLRNWEREEIKVRQQKYGIHHFSPEDVATDAAKVTSWLQSHPASKAVVHLDLDVLDPAEIVLAVGTDPNGMKMEHVERVINAVASVKDLVGITVAENMPRNEIRLKRMLSNLPLFA